MIENLCQSEVVEVKVRKSRSSEVQPATWDTFGVCWREAPGLASLSSVQDHAP